MKYGAYLRDNINPEWADQYLDYDKLKKMIKILQAKFKHANKNPGAISAGSVSVSVPRPTDAAGQPKQPTALDRADQSI